MDIDQLVLLLGLLFGSVKFAIFITIAFGILFLMLYRRTVSNEIEPLPVALTLFGLVETVVVATAKDPTPRVGIMVLFVLILDSVIIILVFSQQRVLTDRHIGEVLMNPLYLVQGISPQDPLVRLEIGKWVKIGRAMVDVDIFPRAPMELIFGARAEHRQRFLDVLPDTTFDKSKLKQETFLIPGEKTRLLRWIYGAAVAISMAALVLLVVVVT